MLLGLPRIGVDDAPLSFFPIILPSGTDDRARGTNSGKVALVFNSNFLSPPLTGLTLVAATIWQPATGLT